MPDKKWTSTGSPVQVASSASTVTLFSANPDVVGRLIFNDSTAALFVKFGLAASTSDFTVKILAGGYYEFTYPPYSGVVTGIWASANGNSYCTELT